MAHCSWNGHVALSTRKPIVGPAETLSVSPPSAAVEQKGSSFQEELNLLTHLGGRKNRSAGGLMWLNSSMPLRLWVALDGWGGAQDPELDLGLGPGPAGWLWVESFTSLVLTFFNGYRRELDKLPFKESSCLQLWLMISSASGNSASWQLLYLILTNNPLSRYSYPYYADEGTEAHKGQNTCSSCSTREWEAGQDLNLGCPLPTDTAVILSGTITASNTASNLYYSL